MRLCAGQASSKLTLLPRSSATGRTAESEYLFWVRFSFHGGEILPQTHVQEMVNVEQLSNCLWHFPACFGSFGGWNLLLEWILDNGLASSNKSA
jgi:hypothetical protein